LYFLIKHYFIWIYFFALDGFKGDVLKTTEDFFAFRQN